MARQRKDKGKSSNKPRVPNASREEKRTSIPQHKSHPIIQPSPQWYASLPPLQFTPVPPPAATPDQIASLTSRASSLHDNDVSAYLVSSTSSEASFMMKIIQSGTLSDRLSALTLLIQSSPLHNKKPLETLKGMAERGKGKGGREESLKALRCLVDWWVGGGAPDRKLKYFRDQPLLHPSVTDQHLVLWYFEDWLKKYFFSVLEILESHSLDPLPYVRSQALNLIFTLLRDKPEQEQNLLRLLVNKLGDTEKSLCSRASYHALQLLQTHPSMKSIVVREITNLVLKPPASTEHSNASNKKQKKPTPIGKKGSSVYARYYATITFNQIVLTPGDKALALQLIDVYFELFKELLGEQGQNNEMGHKEDDAEEEQGELPKDAKGRVIVAGGKRKGKKMREVKGAAGFVEVEDAHSKLISAILTGINRALPYAKLGDGDIGIQKHIDTLFRITHTSTFNISLQALVLIQHISASFSLSPLSYSSSGKIADRYYRTLYDSLHDPRLSSSSKQAMYLNLLYKSIKADAGSYNGERVKALVRRFVQVLVSGGNGATEFVAGGLYLLGELFASIPNLRSLINISLTPSDQAYDPRKRDPQYAHASSSPLWELLPLLHHYHPTISLHTRQLLSGQPLTATPDLSLNTLSHFLDRFVYKNPKKALIKTTSSNNADVSTGVIGRAKGSSAMQPAASGLDGSTVGVKLVKGEVGDAEGLMNEGALLKKRIEDVPVDQVFFYKYFAKKNELANAAAKAKAKAKKRKEDGNQSDSDGSDVDDVNADSDGHQGGHIDADTDDSDDDEQEKEIWKAMTSSMPKEDGDDELLEDPDSDVDLDEDADNADYDEEGNPRSDLTDSDGEDDEGLSLAESSSNDDLISLEDDVDAPDGLIHYDGSSGSGSGSESESNPDSARDEWFGLGSKPARDSQTTGQSNSRKRRHAEDSREKKRRKKLKSLPTFATYDEYAKMIEDGPEDDI